MSWDDSDNDKNKKKDPWSGRKKDQQSPPDLDELVRSMQDKLSVLFGGGPKNPPTGNNKTPGAPAPSGKSVTTLLVIAAIIWLASGIYIIDEGNRGVILRFGAYHETTLPGPHWRFPRPVDSAVVVNVAQERFIEVGYRSGANQQSVSGVRKEALMLTEDENIIDVRLAVQYRIKDAQDYIFNVRSPEVTLKQATESALRAVIGKRKMDFVLTEGRSEVVAKVEVALQAMLDDYGTGLIVSSVNLVEAQPPEEVQGAFSDAIRAREDEQRYINESQAYSNEIIPKARGTASRVVQEAEAYQERVKAEADGDASRFTQLLVQYELAPEVTRKRLYLETMEGVLGNSRKVIMDVKGGNNLMYLPIDKLMESSSTKAAPNRFITPPEKTTSGNTGRDTSYRDRGRAR
ncbi:MAG TPA: FtsH protease activity modulator HflK [Cycloclasticus sp.]|jgi:membrane protease subunit HflK|nr:FtsH protease activity modulator HflK [Cycloclasticus sp.]HIL91473.1 FtsH protease activity modulator HflK [Cycloclasticus sp.]